MCRVQAQASGMLQSDQRDRGRKTGTLQMLMYPEKNWQKHGDDSAQKGPRLNQTQKLVIKWLCLLWHRGASLWRR